LAIVVPPVLESCVAKTTFAEGHGGRSLSQVPILSYTTPWDTIQSGLAPI